MVFNSFRNAARGGCYAREGVSRDFVGWRFFCCGGVIGAFGSRNATFKLEYSNEEEETLALHREREPDHSFDPAHTI